MSFFRVKHNVYLLRKLSYYHNSLHAEVAPEYSGARGQEGLKIVKGPGCPRSVKMPAQAGFLLFTAFFGSVCTLNITGKLLNRLDFLLYDRSYLLKFQKPDLPWPYQ